MARRSAALRTREKVIGRKEQGIRGKHDGRHWSVPSTTRDGKTRLPEKKVLKLHASLRKAESFA